MISRIVSFAVEAAMPLLIAMWVVLAVIDGHVSNIFCYLLAAVVVVIFEVGCCKK